MKKNVVWWIGVKNEKYAEKYGGWEWVDISRKTWEYWCKKHNVLFVPFDKPKHNDFIQYRPQWQKCIYVFDEIDNLGVDFDQIALVDSTAMIKWDCPNFFDLTDRKFVGWRDRDNLGWVYDSVVGYQKIFDNFIQLFFSTTRANQNLTKTPIIAANGIAIKIPSTPKNFAPHEREKIIHKGFNFNASPISFGVK